MHYAVKSLPHEGIITALKEEGSGFDLATSGEVDLVKSLGVEPESCIHTHPIKKDIEIKNAINYGCKIFVFDNVNELQKFKPYKSEVELLLRISFPNP